MIEVYIMAVIAVLLVLAMLCCMAALIFDK